MLKGPSVPSSIPSNAFLIYPQYQNATCYCAIGDYVSGSGFPASYDDFPAVYSTVSCIDHFEAGSASDSTFCVIGTWLILFNFSIGGQFTVGSTISASGNITIAPGTSLNFTSLSAPIVSKSSITIDGSTIISLVPDDNHIQELIASPFNGAQLTSINSTFHTAIVPLFRSRIPLNVTYSSPLPISVQLPPGSCSQVSLQAPSA